MAVLGCIGGLWAFLSLRFAVPNAAARNRLRFRAGPIREFTEEGVYARFRDSHGVWIVCLRISGTRRLLAYRAACTHLGCLTLWAEAEGEFQCPCHGSAFDLAGVNLRGPAPRPLDLCAIRAAGDGYVEIDASRVFRREAGQALPPDSYLLV
ncbi:MAG: ubiquinol-cytochrome c reductase iron-sulfur subunit [Thermogutta sp.]|nr:ubiquinol-cytochrome c reductase iron-sulfur subunit [Thermogutta sp.]